MMMDWVSLRLRGDAAAHSLEAVRERPARQDRRSDRLMAGAGRGGAPSDDDGARLASIHATGDHLAFGHTAVKALSPSSDRMWQACRTILRASDRAARLPSIRSFTCA